MTGSECLVWCLKHHQVDTVFGYPGGAIMPLYDALYDSGIQHILARHEQGASFSAQGYARASGKIGVCLATSGPGATNLVTAIADAHLDSIPLLAITGQVAESLMGTDAFQEVDIFRITLPIVKHSFILRDVRDMRATFEKAVHIATSGRPGPVLIDIPKNIQLASTSLEEQRVVSILSEHSSCDVNLFEQASNAINNAQRPLLYVGGGVVLDRCVDALRAFVERAQIPCVTTLKAVGSLPANHPLLLGMLGMHGSVQANMAIQQCDLLICVGARFDDRATGKLEEFAPNARVIHCDIDAAEIDKLREAHIALPCSASLFFEHVRVACLEQHNTWRQSCASLKQNHHIVYGHSEGTIDGPCFLFELSQQLGASAIVACDVGQHQMWVAQHFQFESPYQHLTSAGLGTMGFGLPAAIGAALACEHKQVLNVTGDGSFLMNVQELATIKRYNIPVKIVILDNQSLGMVRQWQELFFQERYSETDLSDNPDFVKVAQAFGIEAFAIDHPSQVQEAIHRLATHRGPLLCHVRLVRHTHVWPLVPPGQSNAHMLHGKGEP